MISSKGQFYTNWRFNVLLQKGTDTGS